MAPTRRSHTRDPRVNFVDPAGTQRYARVNFVDPAGTDFQFGYKTLII